MSASLAYLLQVTLAMSVAIVLAGSLGKPLRRLVGARLAYWLWLLVPVSAWVVFLPSSESALAVSISSALPAAIRVTAGKALSSEAAPGGYATMLTVAWLVGSIAMLVRMLRRQRYFLRTLGSLMPADDGTYRSELVRSPVLIGILHPRIVLPADFESMAIHG